MKTPTFEEIQKMERFRAMRGELVQQINNLDNRKSAAFTTRKRLVGMVAMVKERLQAMKTALGR